MSEPSYRLKELDGAIRFANDDNDTVRLEGDVETSALRLAFLPSLPAGSLYLDISVVRDFPAQKCTLRIALSRPQAQVECEIGDYHDSAGELSECAAAWKEFGYEKKVNFRMNHAGNLQIGVLRSKTPHQYVYLHIEFLENNAYEWLGMTKPTDLLGQDHEFMQYLRNNEIAKSFEVLLVWKASDRNPNAQKFVDTLTALHKIESLDGFQDLPADRTTPEDDGTISTTQNSSSPSKRAGDGPESPAKQQKKQDSGTMVQTAYDAYGIQAMREFDALRKVCNDGVGAVLSVRSDDGEANGILDDEALVVLAEEATKRATALGKLAALRKGSKALML